MNYGMILPEWSGETCFILGCGPSLKGFDSRCLYQQRVIAINDSYQLAPWSEILYFCDKSWWDSRKSGVRNNFTGKRIVTLENDIDGIVRLRNSGDVGLETDPAALHHGSNSGFQAINLAYHLGARRIVLLGYDMKVDGDSLHWNVRPEGQTPSGFQATLDIMRVKFQSLVQPLQKAGVEVVNATPGSALKCWPNLPLVKILNTVRR